MYDEGLDILNKELTPYAPSEEPTAAERKLKERRFLNHIPSVIVDNNFLSETSKAEDCFVKRHNSRRLQEQLLSYSFLINRSYSVTNEW